VSNIIVVPFTSASHLLYSLIQSIDHLLFFSLALLFACITIAGSVTHCKFNFCTELSYSFIITAPEYYHVFQGIVAMGKAYEAFGGLDQHAKNKREFKMRRDYFRMKNIDEELHGIRTIPASKAFVDVVAEMQQPQSRSVTAYPLQRKLEQQDPKGARTATDPVKYMEHVLRAANSSYIEEAYNASNAYQNFCPNYDDIHASDDTPKSFNPYNKEYQAPTIGTKTTYITPLAPPTSLSTS
jgi:hypothetical protein